MRCNIPKKKHLGNREGEQNDVVGRIPVRVLMAILPCILCMPHLQAQQQDLDICHSSGVESRLSLSSGVGP